MFTLFSVIMLTVKLAFMSGRSKQGKARRASMGENCVEITQLQQRKIKIHLVLPEYMSTTYLGLVASGLV